MTLQELFPAMSGSELAEALWCVVSLRLKPDEQWMDAYMATCEDRVGGLPPQVSCRARGVCVCLCVFVCVHMCAYM